MAHALVLPDLLGCLARHLAGPDAVAAATRGSAIGGRWDWDSSSVGIRAGVTASGNDLDLADLRQVDRKLDDGNLATGMFRKTGAGGYTYVIEN